MLQSIKTPSEQRNYIRIHC